MGPKGDTGADGKSAFELSGFGGTLSDWLLTLVGPQGPQGIAGPVGPIGATGPQGDVGPQGIQGEKGDKGDKGEKGDKGDTGETGAQGLQGIQGLTGAQGEKGDQGAQGETGPQGAVGPQGPIGLTGLTGDTGPQGAQGEKGDKGDAGKSAYDVAVDNGFIGNTQLPYANEIFQKRQKNFETFAKAIYSRTDKYYPLRYDHISFVSNFAVPVVCRSVEIRDELVQKCNGKLEIRPIVGGDMTLQPFYRKHMKQHLGFFKKSNSQLAHQQGLYFGNNPELTAKEIKFIISLMTE
jgi:hypothetical protein